MLNQNVLSEAILEGYAALNRGEEPSVELLDEGFDGVNLPEQALGMPAMSGPEGLLRWIRSIREVWDEFQLVPEKITWPTPNMMVVEVLLLGRGKASAVPVRERFYNVWTIRDERAIRLEVHRTYEEALAAAGARSRR
jgi:hypothetical protein